MESIPPKRSTSQRDFDEALRQFSKKHEARRNALLKIEKSARENSDYALVVASALSDTARWERRLWRRYLHSRFGVKVYSGHQKKVRYEELRPERAPKNGHEKLLRAEAVAKHSEWENVWKALDLAVNWFGPQREWGQVCRFACDALRQAPGIWAFLMESDLDTSVQKRAYQELAGWLDNEIKLYPRIHKELGGREGKLRDLPGSAIGAWKDLEPGEPLWRPNRFTKRRKKGSLMGRAATLLQELAVEAQGQHSASAGAEDEGLAEFEAKETLNALEKEAGFSPRETQVYQRLRQGMEYPEIAEDLSITVNNVYQVKHNVIRKLIEAKKAAGL